MGLDFDEEWYLTCNPDVKLAVSRGQFKSGKDHYLQYGHKEKRSAVPPKVNDSVLRGEIIPQNQFAYPYSKVGDLKPISFAEKSLSLPEDLKLIKRIGESFKLAIKNRPDDFRVDKSGMWSHILSKFYEELIPFLQQNEFEKAAELLSGIFDTEITEGLGMVKTARYHIKLFEKPFASLWADHLIRLSEALGIIKIRSFEQAGGGYNDSLDPNIDELIKKICNIITGNSILIRPNIGKCYGVEIDSTIWNIRDFDFILAAKTVSDLMLERKNISIMEIGGGFGGLAYWFYKIGFRNITIYDVPEMNIIQAYYLSKTLPDIKISFYDEYNKPEKNSSEIKILPYWCLDNVSLKSYDLAINQDSLPEIPVPIAKYYLKKIIETTKEYFYSANQEAYAPNYLSGFLQEPVHELVKDIKELRLLFRSQFWVRTGYAQEIYKIS
jgi:hypothetical protein